MKGVLTQWDDAKGYGFITPDGGGAKLFVHIKAFGLRHSARSLVSASATAKARTGKASAAPSTCAAWSRAPRRPSRRPETAVELCCWFLPSPSSC